MTKTKSFREQMLEARPEIAEREKAFPRKRAIAMKLRALRDARGMTQTDVAEASGLTQSAVARLESLTGQIPKLETIERYVEACDGQMALLISAEAIDLPEAAVA
jgi:transcriptional regulator with XRE-family HTH domain